MGRSLDQRAFRDALGCFATGVTIVTIAAGPRGAPSGITASSFNSVSLEPPLVLFSLERRAHSLKAFLSTRHFAVNVLRAGQEELSARFAEPLADEWAGVPYVTWDTGAPILTDALASFECEIRDTYDGGDHVIFVGEVLRMRADPAGKPLLFFRGRYCGLDGEG